ncbi:MAG: membrane protein insertion efficiency factor YidD [Planctomycetota bacterium]|nr:membrane protein insertion efficiency factor YidD [Planctomycetota bacterium]
MNFFSRPASWLAITTIKAYQRTLSRLWPDVCVYAPSCSHYMVYAIKNKGLVAGIALGVLRIFRCHPFANGGYDPPPGYEEAVKKMGKRDGA